MCDVNERVFDAIVELKDNAMLKVRPELFDEWDFEKNDELGLDVYKVTKGSNKKVWWNCYKCNSDYDMSINHRSRGIKCPYCAGMRINSTNSLSTLNPTLASEWHPAKNGEFTSYDVGNKSGFNAWWRCSSDARHEWEAVVVHRNSGNGCPYCSNQKVLIGYNDIWTTTPDLGLLLLDKEDGYKYTYGSNRKVNWKCPTCRVVIKNKKIRIINSRGLSCINCSDGFKYPEKVMYHVLNSLNIEFECQKTFNWSGLMRYDFYLNDYNMIVETHGAQHYLESHRFHDDSKTLEEQKENDEHKYDLAMRNGIQYYSSIDCMISDFNYIKENIVGSILNDVLILSDINWDEVNIKSQKSMNLEMLRLWNEECLCLDEISKIVKIKHDTISKILRNFETLGLCKYDKNRGRKKKGRDRAKKVYQFDMDYNLVNIWHGATSVEVETGILSSGVRSCCVGTQKTCQGFIWRYAEDAINLGVTPISK